MITVHSEDGRYSITHSADGTGWVQIVEYAGEAPRYEVTRCSVPFEFLSTLMKNFGNPSIVTA